MATSDTLSDKAIRAALARARKTGTAHKLSDGTGLHLDVRPTGVGWWRLRYRFEGKEGMLSLGTYPDTGLALARERRDDARRQLAAGVNPSDTRKADKAAREQAAEVARLVEAGEPVPGTFAHTAADWFQYRRAGWSARHADKVQALLANDLVPFIGLRRLAELTAPEMLQQVRRIEARGVSETAYRALRVASAVFCHGVQQGLCESDPTRDLKGAVKLPLAANRAAVTDPAKLGELLRAFDGYKGTPTVRAALALTPLVFLRPGELRHAEWAEIDLDKALWTIPAARMKGTLEAKAKNPPHLVPLARQAVAVLRELHPLTGHGRFVFPSPLTDEKPMSENAILAALRRMQFTQAEVTGHGFRATARTLAVERLGLDAEVVEAQLAHKVKDALGRAYNRTQFLQQRRALMQAWADYLDRLRQGAEVLPLRGSAGR
jgi:integrase